MKRKRFTEEQIIGVLKEHELGAKTADLCRKHGVSEATFYKPDSPSRLAESLSRTIALHPPIGRPASRTRRSAPCRCSKSTVGRLLSQMPSIVMWASSRISIRPTHGRLHSVTR